MKRYFLAILLTLAMMLCPLTAFAGDATEITEHNANAAAESAQAAAEGSKAKVPETGDADVPAANAGEAAVPAADTDETAAAERSEAMIPETGDAGVPAANPDNAGVPAAGADEPAANEVSKAESAGSETSREETGNTETTKTEPADPEPQITEGWNADRSVYYLNGGVKATGLFKAPMQDGTGALFYADAGGIVVKTPGIITVRAPEDRYLCTVDREGRRGFRKVASDDKATYSYLIGENGEGAIVEAANLYTTRDRSKTYCIQENGTVRTVNGFANVGGARYYIEPNGQVRTKVGWLKFKDRKYRIGPNGKVRTKTGAFTVNGRRYVIPDSSKYGALCISAKKVVKANGRLYYVKNKHGVLGAYRAYKVGKKVYHVNKNGVVKRGRHKWKDGKYYYSVPKGYLKMKTALLTKNGKRFLVSKGGLITVSQKFTYKKKTYIANKYGTIKTGLFKWKGTLYYAGEKGVLEQDAGIVRISGKDYYVSSDGTVYVNRVFSSKGKKYASDSDGVLMSGFIHKGSKYYYADSDYVIVTTKQILIVDGKYYFCKKGGRLARNEWVNYRHKHYYAGDNAAFKTSVFSYNGITISPGRGGEISDEEYKKVFPAQDKQEQEQNSSDNGV